MSDSDGCVTIEQVEELVDQRMAERETEIREAERAEMDENYVSREEHKEALSERDERIDELESELEQRPDVELRTEDDEQTLIGDVWIGNLPIGKAVELRGEETTELTERVEAIERGEIEADGEFSFGGGLTHEDLMPLHQKRLIAEHMEPDQHRLTQNQERAAWSIDHLGTYMHNSHGTGTLTSNDLRKLFARELSKDEELDRRLRLSDPNPNTIRRTMRFIAEFSDGVIEWDASEKVNRLEVDVKEFNAYWDQIEKKTNEKAEVVTPS